MPEYSWLIMIPLAYSVGEKAAIFREFSNLVVILSFSATHFVRVFVGETGLLLALGAVHLFLIRPVFIFLIFFFGRALFARDVFGSIILPGGSFFLIFHNEHFYI